MTFLATRIGRWLAGAVAALLALAGFAVAIDRNATQRAENRSLKDAAKRERKGREAVSDMRDFDRPDWIEQLRKNGKRY